jgi:hypothetical protein
MELVTGKPNGRAISTAFSDGPLSAWSGVAATGFACSVALADIAEAFPDAFIAKA